MAILETPEEQITQIKKVTSHRKYVQFYFEHFVAPGKDTLWLNRLNKALPNSFLIKTSPDYFHLLAVAANQFAQFGMPSLEGQLFRHHRKKFTRSPFDPMHQLAIACYGARINQEAFPIKQDFSSAFQHEGDTNSMHGVWGVQLAVSEGKVAKEIGSINAMRAVASDRMTRSKPICLPNQQLNKELAGIKFRNEEYGSTIADNISPSEFQEEVFPQAHNILNGLMNVEAALLDYQTKRMYVSWLPINIPTFNK